MPKTSITVEEYLDAVTKHILNNKRPNEEQAKCICHNLKPDLLIVAGPGTGKTTVLVLRALKHVIVDRVPPEEIVVTTFTRKAAGEIRGRLIAWGVTLIEHFKAVAARKGMKALQAHLSLADVSAFITGTLDSLCEEWLGRMRRQGETPPVMIEEFAARQIYARKIFQAKYYDPKLKQRIQNFLARYAPDQDPPTTQGEAVRIAKGLIDRLVQDRVNIKKYAKAPGKDRPMRALLAQSLLDLHKIMCEAGQFDFALLEQEFLDRRSDPKASHRLPKTSVLLVDEYQDTNPLQEEIYFALTKLNACSITIVGDDDQSLYRFRGATVELFRDFSDRLTKKLKRPKPTREFLVHNYRSTEHIVEFFNAFIHNDDNFSTARVRPLKPRIKHTRDEKSVPLLGMFRDNEDELATDLAKFLVAVFHGPGYLVPGTSLRIKRDKRDGDVGDAVLMAHSVAEYGRSFFGKPPAPRFPWTLRQELVQHGIRVFNPRGRALKDIPEVQAILGIVSLCIDPDEQRLNTLSIYNELRTAIRSWRAAGQDFIDSNPVPKQPHTLKVFVRAWQTTTPQKASGSNKWPDEWPILDLLYKLLAWFPNFRNDPEYQIYLEAITRSVTQATAFSPYQGRILHRAPHFDYSRDAIIRDVLAPLADNVIDVDEDLLIRVPRDHLNIMTIHQSKGLEFPMVIVDVGSGFTRDHHLQRFRRFPDQPSSVALVESDLAPYTDVGRLRIKRDDIDRTFEDLIRLYYVAYSRPQSVLLLVGNRKLLQQGTKIKNVATFWRQDCSWAWAPQQSKKKEPAVAVHPLKEI